MCIKDRLFEFRLRSSSIRRLSAMHARSSSVQRDYVTVDEDCELMLQFLEIVYEVYCNIEEIEEEINKVASIQSDALKSNGVNKSATQRLPSHYDSIRSKSSEVWKEIKELEVEVKDSKYQGSDTEYRICLVQLSSMTAKLNQCLTRFYEVQREYEQKCHLNMQRQIEIDIRPEGGSEEAPASFSETIMAEADIVKKTRKQLEQRHEELHRVERSIIHLNCLFTDIALLIQTQGEIIDRVDFTIRKASLCVRLGKQQLDEAEELNRKQQKKCCIIIIIVVAFVTALLITLSLAFKSGGTTEHTKN